MAKQLKREVFLSRTASYKKKIDLLLQEEQQLLDDKKPAAPFALADIALNISSYYIVFQKFSLSLLSTSDDGFLAESRKYVLKAIISLEAVASNRVDAPFSDYEDKLVAIESVNPARRFALAQKLGLTIDLFEQSLGENSRWKWFCVDLAGRVAAIIKNLIDLKKIGENRDIYSPWYDATTSHLDLAKEALFKAAERYQLRYQIATSQPDDFRIAINFLYALRRLHFLLGESSEAMQLKKKIDNWSLKFEERLRRG
jgi:hypothetical protein